MATEGVSLDFTTDGIQQMAEIAFNVNEKTENIGARRLYTIMERLLEDASFAPENYPEIIVDSNFVNSKLKEISESEDLSRYVL